MMNQILKIRSSPDNKDSTIVRGVVLDNTVHLSHTPHLFGTRGSLILDISIASYYNIIFRIIFLYFILQVKPQQETMQGVPLPQQMAGNVGNGNP